MAETVTITLEQQVAYLQAQVEFLLGNQSRAKTPARRLEEIRTACRKKYFGTFNDVKEGNTDYGPENKWYSDYSVIADIVRRTTDMLYRYSLGRGNGGSAVASLITSEEGMKAYEAICDAVCRNLKERINEYSKRKE